MHQAILTHADVDEGTERCQAADNTLNRIAGFHLGQTLPIDLTLARWSAPAFRGALGARFAWIAHGEADTSRVGIHTLDPDVDRRSNLDQIGWRFDALIAHLRDMHQTIAGDSNIDKDT